MAVHAGKLPEPEDRAAVAALAFLRDLLGGYHPRDFAVRLWDGTIWPPEPGQPERFTLVLKGPESLRRMARSPSELSLAEAYVFDDVDVEGDIESATGLADHLVGFDRGLAGRLRGLVGLAGRSAGRRRAREGRPAARPWGSRHSVARDRQAVRYHYDVSNDFYTLWLDSRMVYSCAYFAGPGDDLDAAQERKLDYVCRKLRLRRGERLLDIGCGWGGLLIHAAKAYGVRAHGITLSPAQAALARDRIREAGVADLCRVDVRDYRDIAEPESYDKSASVGMFEHVGESRLPEYFSGVFRLLRPGGVFLNHGIACSSAWPPKRGPSFIDRYVFPDGELVPLHATLRVAESCGFEVRDVESLREHYALTLRHWVRRLETSREAACRLVDEPTYRVWRLYMSGAARDFDRGRITVYQTLLVKSGRDGSRLPLTRSDWYA